MPSIIEKEVQEILAEKNVADLSAILPATEMLENVCEYLTNPPTGATIPAWPEFNKVMGGLRPREFTVFSGTSGTGKTLFLANLSSRLITSTVPHFVASIETGPIDYLARMISALEGRDLNSGEAQEKEETKALLKKWTPLLSKRGLFLSSYTNKISPTRLLCDILTAHKEYGCRLAFLDNLNFLMPIVNARDTNTEMDRIIHDFVIFCKNVDMHIFLVMHPRKREDDTGAARVENEYDIKGSSTVIQEAHNVLLLNRPTKAQEEELNYSRHTHRELKFAKLRRRGSYIGSRIMYECLGTRFYEKKLFT